MSVAQSASQPASSTGESGTTRLRVWVDDRDLIFRRGLVGILSDAGFDVKGGFRR